MGAQPARPGGRAGRVGLGPSPKPCVPHPTLPNSRLRLSSQSGPQGAGAVAAERERALLIRARQPCFRAGLLCDKLLKSGRSVGEAPSACFSKMHTVCQRGKAWTPLHLTAAAAV